MGRRTGWRAVFGSLLLAAELTVLGAGLAHAGEGPPAPVHFDAAPHPAPHDHAACPSHRTGAMDHPAPVQPLPVAVPAARLPRPVPAQTAWPRSAPSTLADARAPPGP